jgi:hypothetical protein
LPALIAVMGVVDYLGQSHQRSKVQVNLLFSILTIGIAAAVAIVEANDMDRITVGH